ncbi:MAG: RecX family transcriptional regulator [Candidatus Omnitrophica bacterium]|nr:RecX family transcriptional regulator [Candidatus Omnitrophota bacterium]
MKDLDKALNFAFLLLKYRARSINEMKSRLKAKGYSSALRDKVIVYLLDYNYLNDKDFAESYVNSALDKGWGPRKIDYKLKTLGIAQDLRSSTLENIDCSSRLKEIVLNKLKSLKKRNPDISKKLLFEKTARFLAAKGFNYQDIYLSLKDVL